MNRLKIAFVKQHFEKKGGLEKQAFKIFDYLSACGHLVTLIAETIPPSFHYPYLKTKPSLPISFLKSYAFNQEVKKALREHHFDLVFGLDRTEAQTITRLGNGVQARFLEIKREEAQAIKKWGLSSPQDLVALWIEKKIFSDPKLQFILANSHMVKKEVIRFYGLDEKKITVIHNGVQWHEYAQPFEEQFSLSSSYDPQKIHFLFIGHGFKRKGLHYLIQALGQLPFKDFNLHVIGVDKKSKAYRALAKKNGIENQVLFHGKQEKTLPFFQLADCCVIPSLYDPFANVTVEALAMGIPVISSLHNGGHEVLNLETSSILNRPDNISDLTQLLIKHYKKKTVSIATKIRNEVEYLDFSYQLSQLKTLIDHAAQRPIR